jgi:two-component system LytT family response regulator
VSRSSTATLPGPVHAAEADPAEGIRTLLAEPDPIARERLRHLLERAADFVLVGECDDGVQTVQAILTARPELVILGAHLPRLDAPAVIEAVGAERMPVTVFAGGGAGEGVLPLDRLEAPLDQKRALRVLARARQAVEARRDVEEQAAGALVAVPRGPVAFPDMLAVKVGDRFHFVDVGEIDYVEADRKHTRIYVQKTVRLASRSMTEMEERVLDPQRFVRIHRSTIVNLARIAYVEPLFHGELSGALKDGTRLVCSRRFRARLQARVHFTT